MNLEVSINCEKSYQNTHTQLQVDRKSRNPDKSYIGIIAAILNFCPPLWISLWLVSTFNMVQTLLMWRKSLIAMAYVDYSIL